MIVFLFFFLYFILNPYYFIMLNVYKSNGIACIFGKENAFVFLFTLIPLSLITNAFVLKKAYIYFTQGIKENNLFILIFAVYTIIYSWFLLSAVMFTDQNISCRYDYSLGNLKIKSLDNTVNIDDKNIQNAGTQLSNFCSKNRARIPNISDTQLLNHKESLSKKGDLILLFNENLKSYDYYTYNGKNFQINNSRLEIQKYHFCILNTLKIKSILRFEIN
ncbi:hypothetical protein EHQ23_06975 [Leptospira bourretii]|uniref:Uncharacterized protein n=3 Tax=Leptospira bourretii TaxID=2484962 RepID=A0A4R9IML8_9LEPT|nr:hypothetical protein [Leptospira bourretii]TGK88562.1 hypothetical protein EHQ23_06975 [Leptospira bourretii]TGK92240.1 hypothetical protein EHQ26_09695 [Leptospira bourretii]TGL19779.1 hypothetical protein EHQ47_16920 [Leptospira bourretii]